MSMDDSQQQQDCTVYIQQLKSDNPTLKIGAANKLPVIASVLGHNRIRDQLVPYIIQIIQQMDNQNQFLIQIAQGLHKCKQFCNSQQQCHILIPPLKILSSLDQPSVRQKAVQSILKLSQNLDNKFYQNHIYPLIVLLSDKKQPYSPRVSATHLITPTYPHVNQDMQTQLQVIYKRLGVQENSPLVRRAVAQCIQNYSSTVGKTIVKKDCLQIWQKFIVDKIDIVKIKALQTAHILAKFFKKQQILEKFFKYIKIVDPQKKSWRVRYALIQCVSSMLPFLEKDIIKKDCVQIFQQLLKDNQAQVRTISLLKLPQLTSKLPQTIAFGTFFSIIQKSSKDTSLPVKMALVQMIVGYLKSIDTQKLPDNAIPLISSLLKDQNQPVRIELAHRIPQLGQVLQPQNTQKYLFGLIQSLLNDKKWRFKLAIVEGVTKLFKKLDINKNKSFLDKIIKTYIKDHYAAVRQQTITSLCQLSNVLGSERSMELIGQTIKSLINQNNCYYRITACHSLKNAGKVLEKNDFNELFSFICKKLQNDKVPNVLLSFFNSYGSIKSFLTPQSKKQFQNLIKKSKQLKDQDVLYFGQKFQE